MEKKVASFKEYEIFVADKSCLNEIANFVVRENYSHHIYRERGERRYQICA